MDSFVHTTLAQSLVRLCFVCVHCLCFRSLYVPLIFAMFSKFQENTSLVYTWIRELLRNGCALGNGERQVCMLWPIPLFLHVDPSSMIVEKKKGMAQDQQGWPVERPERTESIDS